LMMFAFATLALGSVTFQDFQAWQQVQGKRYNTKTEGAKRFRIFQDNDVRIQAMRLNNPKETFALNRFADLTKAEFVGKYNGFRANISEVRAKGEVAARLPVDAAPTSADWRNTSGIVAPIQDQGQCGSCWAFSATANLESRIAIDKKTTVRKLAEQSLVDCEKGCGKYRNFNGCDDGCNAGLMPNAWVWAKTKGMPDESSYPYTASDGDCQSFTAVSKPTGWEFIAIDEVQIAAYVATKSPVSIAVDASNWQFYNGGIMSGTDICATQDPSNPNLDHGVVIVGYGTESGTDFWIVRNSWATSWGEDGYVRFVRGSDYCGVALFACSSKVL